MLVNSLTTTSMTLVHGCHMVSGLRKVISHSLRAPEGVDSIFPIGTSSFFPSVLIL